MECGKRVGKGVVTYPCVIQVQAGGVHAGPCMSPDNPASVRTRRTYDDAAILEQRSAAVGDPDATVALRTMREGYPPSTAPTEADWEPVAEPFTKTADRGGQPVPVHQPGRPSTHDLLVVEIEKRKALGLSRYGTILQAHNGRDALQDMLDELIDAAVYLIQLIEERKTQP